MHSIFLQVMWDDIVGEPEGLRTPDTCWDCSIKCYDGSRRCCYVFLVVIFAPIIACLNGCQFACLAFNVSDFKVCYFLNLC